MERLVLGLIAVTFLFIAAAQAAGLADGTDVGSIAGNLWTPGRQNGVVNKVSWDTVPTGKWINVADTRLDALQDEVTAAMPGWNDPSSNKWGGVAEAWNSVAIDEPGHRAWWVAAGGHGNGANNGIYVFEAFKMKYSIEKMPSDTRQWSDAYRRLQNTGTYTSCNESATVAAQKKANGTLSDVNDWYYDELYWDNQPTSRHVYSGAIFVPERNELVLAVRRVWRYSLTERKWFFKMRALGANDYQTGAALGEEIIANYDQKRDQLLVISCGSGGPFSNTLNMSNSKWTMEQVWGEGWDWNGAAEYRHNNSVVIFRPLDPEGPNNPSLGRYMRYDIIDRVFTGYGTVQYDNTTINRNDFELTDGNGMVYIPPLDKYWVVQSNKTAGNYALSWMELDPSTTPWTYKRLTFDSPTPKLSWSSLVRRRMMWLPNMNAVIWLGAADQNIAIYKFGAYVPIPPTTTVATSASTSTTTTTTATTTTAAAATTKSASSTSAAATTSAATSKAAGSTTTTATTKASATTTTAASSAQSTSTATSAPEATSTTTDADNDSSAAHIMPVAFVLGSIVALIL